MKKTNALYCITAGNPKKLIKPVVWTVLADLVNLFPFGCLTLVVSSIYLYFGGTSDTLNTKQLWLVWGGMVILAIILYLFERKAVHATYHDGYDASAKGRVQLAEHIRKLPLGFLMSKDPGELGNTMMNDFAQIEEAVTHVLPQLIGGFITSCRAGSAWYRARSRRPTPDTAAAPSAPAGQFGGRQSAGRTRR